MTVIFYVEGRKKKLSISSFLRYYSIDTTRRFNPRKGELPATYWQSKRSNKLASVLTII